MALSKQMDEPLRQHVFRKLKEDEEIALKDDGSVCLFVPAGTFDTETTVAWKILPDRCNLQTLEISARHLSSGKQIKRFPNYLKIFYRGLHSGYCVEVDGHEVPIMMSSRTGELESETSRCFYEISNGNIVVYTKHFSKFRLKCDQHRGQNDVPFSGILKAAFFYREEMTEGGMMVTVKIMLLTSDTLLKTKVSHVEDYKYLDVFTLDSPQDSDRSIIARGTTITVSVYDPSYAWRCIKGTDQNVIENLVRCRDCEFPDDYIFPTLTLQLTTDYSSSTASTAFIPMFTFSIDLYRSMKFGFQTSVNVHIPVKLSNRSPVETRSSRERPGFVPAETQPKCCILHCLPCYICCPAEQHRIAPENQHGGVVLKQPQMSSRSSEILSSYDNEQTEDEVEIRDLTDEDVLEISLHLTDKTDVRKLGVHLGVDNNVMENCFTKHGNNLPEAAHEILSQWRRTQEEDSEAYYNLCIALTHPKVKLNKIAATVLGYRIIQNNRH